MTEDFEKCKKALGIAEEIIRLRDSNVETRMSPSFELVSEALLIQNHQLNEYRNVTLQLSERLISAQKLLSSCAPEVSEGISREIDEWISKYGAKK